jgi:hypothetical protein
VVSKSFMLPVSMTWCSGTGRTLFYAPFKLLALPQHSSVEVLKAAPQEPKCRRASLGGVLLLLRHQLGPAGGRPLGSFVSSMTPPSGNIASYVDGNSEKVEPLSRNGGIRPSHFKPAGSRAVSNESSSIQPILNTCRNGIQVYLNHGAVTLGQCNSNSGAIRQFPISRRRHFCVTDTRRGH